MQTRSKSMRALKKLIKWLLILAVAAVVGFTGRLVFDATKPDGAPLKALDSTPLLEMGWRPESDFRTALAETYHWFLHHRATEGRTHARRAV